VTQDRNLRECFDGSDLCDRSHLTATEQRDMAALKREQKVAELSARMIFP
jgi:hypothetical protein